MGLFKLVPFKIAVPKTKPKHNTNDIKRTTNKIVKGTVFKEEDGTYKICMSMENDETHPDFRILSFTDRSFELKGKTNVFSRTTDKYGRYTRFIRNETDAKHMPGMPEKYVPFAPNWIVKGYIVKDNNIVKFDFKSLVGISGYDINDHDHDDSLI